MNRILTIAFLLIGLGAEAAVNTYLLVPTNTPTGPGFSITAGTRTRVWSNSYSPTLILTNLVGTNGVATNLFRAFSAYPQSDATVSMTNHNTLVFRGLDLVIYQTGGWASVTTNSSPSTNTYALAVPPDNIPSTTTRSNNANYISEYLSEYSSTAIVSNAPALANYLTKGASASQSVIAPVVFYNFSGTNGGVIYAGSYAAPILISPTTTNLVNYGNAISSPGTNTNSEQFGTEAEATGVRALAVGYRADALAQDSTAVGNAAQATNISGTAVGSGARAFGTYSSAFGYSTIADAANAVAIGASAQANEPSSMAIGSSADASHTNSVAIGDNAVTTRNNQVRIGASYHTVSVPGVFEAATSTNSTLTGTTLVSIVRYTIQTISTLAAGNNTLPALTASHAEITTTGSAFSIVGIPAGASGQILELVNLTGQNMTVAHESGVEATAANRIISLTGSDRATTGNGAARLRYSASQSRWILTHLDP